MLEITNQDGKIIISQEAIANIVGNACRGTPGIVGMVSKNVREGFSELLKKDSYSKGVKISISDNILEITTYVRVLYGIHIPNICCQLVNVIKQDIKIMIGEINTKVYIHVQDIEIENH